jgi:Ca2+-binding EF-hand superfamily protein
MHKSLIVSLAAFSALAAAGAAHAQAEPRGTSTRAEAEQRTAEMFGRMDANDDGVLNQADREAARREAFDAIDADKNGAISFAEFDARRDGRREERADRRGPGGPEGMGRRGGRRGPGMERAADTDNDGTVTQAEFTTAALARFDRADANSDGTISTDERRDARREMRHHMRRDRPAREAG